MADKYIRKTDAVNAVEHANGNMTWAERDDCKKRLKELPPADVVQVIRCKDCERCEQDAVCGQLGRLWCKLRRLVKPDDFCSYGKRKER